MQGAGVDARISGLAARHQPATAPWLREVLPQLGTRRVLPTEFPAGGQNLNMNSCSYRASCSATQTATVQPSHQPELSTRLSGKLKIMGLGARGATAVSKLLHSGRAGSAELWYIDTEGKAVDAADVPNKLLLPAEGTAMSPAQLARLAGNGAHDKHGKGNINTGDGGIAFIIASAGGIPGGSESLLSLVRSLRGAGLFTVVAITFPFEFEGARRLQGAATLVECLDETAHLVAVINQNNLSEVKTNSSGVPMTVAEATEIADNALEHTVRCILAAVQASEVLKCSRGALIWHGSEMHRFKRLLSPPLQHLLARPGQAALGRGVAAMPRDMQQNMGYCQALMHLASDAVKAAAESPFLEGSAQTAGSALCCVSLPQSEPLTGNMSGSFQSGQKWGSDQAACRLAVQAAAGGLLSICQCEDIIMCYTASEQDTGDQLRVEVSLLVLQNGSGNPVTAVPRLEKQQSAAAQLQQEDPSRGPAGGDSNTPHPQVPGKMQRLPASTWGALSAIAGGAAKSKPGSPSTGQSLTHAQKAVDNSPGKLNRSRGSGHQAEPLKGLESARSVREMIMVSAKASRDEQEINTVGDQLAENLIAQSLDLPPKAAKWRQSQRAKTERPRLMVQAPEAAWQAQDDLKDGLTATVRSLLGGPQQEFDVRERTFAILERDRGDTWEQVDED